MEKEESNPTQDADMSGDIEKVIMDPEVIQALDKLVMDTTLNRYDAILLARRWAYELKSKESDGRSIQELIPQAVFDILSARISQKSVRDLPVLKTVKKGKLTAAALFENIGKAPVESDSNDKPKTSESPKKKS
ncbi:MAG: hypothetical protein A2902_04150 [Elusimicrobia bacterium RIFCSPLOWO2_01_FULL_64_13]|nr:MAG: hypothetical protein A2636_01365 [Elusimicrobia bacterium RIFCSPHIGHO2_01_FULL_64_10]OGR96859.1 MAG: hypothetical protein A2902_04150 [Elusimicrobia bacterium RIFCSPLOWO2_01_FULL_64_13]